MSKTTLAAFPDTKWQADEDQRTLARAAEVVSSRARLKAAMRLLTKQANATKGLVDVLARRQS